MAPLISSRHHKVLRRKVRVVEKESTTNLKGTIPPRISQYGTLQGQVNLKPSRFRALLITGVKSAIMAEDAGQLLMAPPLTLANLLLPLNTTLALHIVSIYMKSMKSLMIILN